MFIYNKFKNGALNRVQQYENTVKRNNKLSPKERQDKLDKVKDGIKRQT